MIQKEYQRQGVHMKTDKIVRNLLEKATNNFLETTRKNEEESMLVSKNERLSHFEKNYKKK